MALGRRWFLAGLGGLAACGALRPGWAQPAAPTVRIGILKFGSVSWQIEVIGRHQLDKDAGIALDVVELASNQATVVALQAGRVDVIVSDLLWVARQRAGGADWTFVPYSSALGAVEVAAASPIREIGDLAGKRLGIAGSPLDKSWLLLRLLSRRDGADLDAKVEKSFGAPPLLAEEFAAGRLDAVLTFWQFAARLEAKGARRLVGIDEVMRRLGIEEPVPLVGYVLSEGWARANRAAAGGFLKACRGADEILEKDDGEWTAIAGLTGAADASELEKLREAFRRGIPRHGGEKERAASAKLYGLFAEIGGETLIGPSSTLPPGTFLDGIAS